MKVVDGGKKGFTVHQGRLKPNLLDTAKSHYKLTGAIDFLQCIFDIFLW